MVMYISILLSYLSYMLKCHVLGLEWTKEGLRTYVDDETVLQVDFDKTAWDRGQFTKPTMNPWKGGDISAPFDQEFYLVLC
jgi:hypothetical protein